MSLSQRRFVQLHPKKTLDATPVTQRIRLPFNEPGIYRASFGVQAQAIDGSASRIWDVDCALKITVLLDVELIGEPEIEFDAKENGAAGWSVDVQIEDGGIVLSFTGDSTPVSWTASCEVTS